ncbi:MAG TPA: hypothetical protein VKY37_03520 [Brumimicrobium sp.]|nr:hypothetical protein [Brumimicrobium sp.]
MKKSFLIAAAGIVAVGGLTIAAVNQWGSAESKNATTKNVTAEHANEIESIHDEVDLPYAMSFYIDHQPHSIQFQKNGFSQPKPILTQAEFEPIEMEKYFTTSLMSKDVFKALPISDNMIFYAGVQSNLDPNLWVYLERVDEGKDFNVRMYNTLTKEKKILFGRENSPNKDYAYRPFAFSNDNSVVYLEGLIFDLFPEHEEVWELNLETLEFKELPLHSFYDYTPAMSPDGKYFLYTAASQPTDVHVTPNQLYIYDLEKDKEIRVIADDKAFIGMIGWIKAK